MHWKSEYLIGTAAGIGLILFFLNLIMEEKLTLKSLVIKLRRPIYFCVNANTGAQPIAYMVYSSFLMNVLRQ